MRPFTPARCSALVACSVLCCFYALLSLFEFAMQLADVPCAYKPDYPFGKESTASGAGAPGAPMGNVLGMGELMRKKRDRPCRYAPMAT